MVVEQTETPDQLKIRNEERKASKQNMVNCMGMQRLLRERRGPGRVWPLLRGLHCRGLLLSTSDMMLAGRGCCWQADALTLDAIRKGVPWIVQVKVVNRELVAILTKGTLTDAEMLQTTPDAAYLLAGEQGCVALGLPSPRPTYSGGCFYVCCMFGVGASCWSVHTSSAIAQLGLAWIRLPHGTCLPTPAVTEELVEDSGAADAIQHGHSAKHIRFGACAVDVATGRMLLGQW